MGRSPLESLWRQAAAEAATGTFHPRTLDPLPRGAQQYLRHAVAPGTPLACAVRLAMHGEIKLKEWLPFRAEQVIHRTRGFVWRASVRRGPVTVRGADSYVDGHGHMRWRLFGLIPVMTAEGVDVTRSNAGRFLGEALWLPTMFLQPTCHWDLDSADRPVAALETDGVGTRITLSIDEAGRPASASFPRWGATDGAGDFREATFGVHVDDERTFDGYTVPTRIRAGWHFGRDAFEEGEFFRASVTSARFR